MPEKNPLVTEVYEGLLQGVVRLPEEARKTPPRSANAIMTATYWEIGHRIVEREQEGRRRAGYDEALIERLAADMTAKFGRGFSRGNLWQMRGFLHGLANSASRACTIRKHELAKRRATKTPDAVWRIGDWHDPRESPDGVWKIEPSGD